MTIDKLLKLPAEKLASMSDEDLKLLLQPYMATSRPDESAQKPTTSGSVVTRKKAGPGKQVTAGNPGMSMKKAYDLLSLFDEKFGKLD